MHRRKPFSMSFRCLWNNSFVRSKLTQYFLATPRSTRLNIEMITEWDVLFFPPFFWLGQCAPVAPPTQLERCGRRLCALVEAGARKNKWPLWLAGLAASPLTWTVIGWRYPDGRERQKTSLSGVLESTGDSRTVSISRTVIIGGCGYKQRRSTCVFYREGSN